MRKLASRATLLLAAAATWLVAVSAGAAPARQASELMAVDFMSAVENEGGAYGVTPAQALLAPSPPAMPPQMMPPATVIDTPEPDCCVPTPGFFTCCPKVYCAKTCPCCQPWTRGYLGSNYGMICTCHDREINGLVINAWLRGYYLNDQRIEWSGVESSLGAEGVVIPRIVYDVGEYTIAGNSVFFINQPLDRNILVTPERQSYIADFQVDPFQIWNLNLSVTRGNFKVTIGKDNTPFGRYYFPTFTNSRIDAPFIRTEAIGWLETGLFVRYTPGIFSIDAVLTNGGVDRDTNSSKAFVGRVGIQLPNFVVGASAKIGDGVGSEYQKEYNNVVGCDFMVRRGQWDLSGEAIYNQYGFRKPFDPNNIFWGRDLYYRDTYSGTIDGGLTGVGYYVNLGRTWPRMRADLNYGTFFPKAIGNPLVDTLTRRGFAKATFLIMPRLETYGMLMLENNRPTETFRQNQKGVTVLTGFQTYF